MAGLNVNTSLKRQGVRMWTELIWLRIMIRIHERCGTSSLHEFIIIGIFSGVLFHEFFILFLMSYQYLRLYIVEL
jgi:hypothetical protein